MFEKLYDPIVFTHYTTLFLFNTSMQMKLTPAKVMIMFQVSSACLALDNFGSSGWLEAKAAVGARSP